ncbi:hypothetical protein ET464_19225 [Paenibacillus protaetiae]|uniref:SCP domain-containing protein n=2 Tax=Paenibacillus protaetiae TaxID=2509456 RepID=A0A4P6F5W2_9BACL|nr:hypothetical protein ET464_19225 [Paenibacillus protaetiae]
MLKLDPNIVTINMNTTSALKELADKYGFQITNLPNGVFVSNVVTVTKKPDTSTAAKKPDTSTAAKKPGTSAAAKPGTSAAAKKPGTSAAAKKPGTSAAAKKPGTSAAAKKPGTSAAAKKPGTGAAAKPGTSTAAKKPSTGAAASMSDFQSQVVQLVNQERQKAGLPALQADALLTKVATAKAKDMNDNHYFDHNSPTYGSPFNMMSSFGVTYSYAGENIASGQQTPAAVMEAWMNSQGHRDNILSKNFTKIGVGYVNGQWVQEFTG